MGMRRFSQNMARRQNPRVQFLIFCGRQMAISMHLTPAQRRAGKGTEAAGAHTHLGALLLVHLVGSRFDALANVNLTRIHQRKGAVVRRHILGAVVLRRHAGRRVGSMADGLAGVVHGGGQRRVV